MKFHNQKGTNIAEKLFETYSVFPKLWDKLVKMPQQCSKLVYGMQCID